MAVTVKMTVELAGGSGADGAPLPVQTHEDVVTLQPDAVFFRNAAGNKAAINFALRRTFELNEKTRTYRENSLYADIGFRHFESLNRHSISQVLKSAQANMPGFEGVLIEHHLSVLNAQATTRTTIAESPTTSSGWFRLLFSKNEPHDIMVDLRDGFLTYATKKGRVLIAHSVDGHSSEPDVLQQLVRYLRSQYNGHPLILDRLGSNGRIPCEIRYENLAVMEGSHERRTIRVHSAEASQDRFVFADNYRRVVEMNEVQPSDPVDATVLRALSTKPEDPAALRTRRMAEFEASLAAGRNVEAALTVCELNLESDLPPAELGAPMKRTMNEQVTELMTAVSNMGQTSDEVVTKQLLGILSRHRPAAGSRAHVLNTFEAVGHTGLGQLDVARDKLLEAVTANPRLVGAYKDLGDLCQREYSMQRAWLCYEAARRFCPRHSMLQDIDALEKSLETDHPEFF